MAANSNGIILQAMNFLYFCTYFSMNSFYYVCLPACLNCNTTWLESALVQYICMYVCKCMCVCVSVRLLADIANGF